MFFSLPYRGHLGQGGQGETMEKEGDTQEFWMKMGQWSWLLCCKKLLQVWLLKEESGSITQDPLCPVGHSHTPPQRCRQTLTTPRPTLARGWENPKVSLGRTPQECIPIFKTIQ